MKPVFWVRCPMKCKYTEENACRGRRNNFLTPKMCFNHMRLTAFKSVYLWLFSIEGS